MAGRDRGGYESLDVVFVVGRDLNLSLP